MLLRCLPLPWLVVVVGLNFFCLSAEEHLFYYLYSISLSFLTPIVSCTYMCFHCAYWKRLWYPDAWALYCCTLLLRVHNCCVSINIYLQGLVRTCAVVPVFVQLLPGEWEEARCCGWCIFLPVLFGLSSSASAVGASVVCWSVSGVGYWIQHLCQHLILGLVERLVWWLDPNLVTGCSLDPGAGSEILVCVYVQQYRWLG